MERRGSKQPFSVERRQGRHVLESFKPKAGCAGSIPASPPLPLSTNGLEKLGGTMQKRWQTTDGWLYCMATTGQGIGFGFMYRPCNFEVWLGPLIIDFSVPSPLWWRMRRAEKSGLFRTIEK